MASTIATLIKNYVITDVNDTTAASIRTNPANAIFGWTLDAQVPVYLYTSLSTLFMNVQGSGDWTRRVIDSTGEASNVITAPGSIIIRPPDKAFEAVLDPEGIHSDAIGAESVDLIIEFQTARPVATGGSADFSRLINCELRLRCLIDYLARGKTRTKIPDLPLIGDNTLDSSAYGGYFKAFWRGWLMNPEASTMLVRYKVEYVRIFGASNIP